MLLDVFDLLSFGKLDLSSGTKVALGFWLTIGAIFMFLLSLNGNTLGLPVGVLCRWGGLDFRDVGMLLVVVLLPSNFPAN